MAGEAEPASEIVEAQEGPVAVVVRVVARGALHPRRPPRTEELHAVALDLLDRVEALHPEGIVGDRDGMVVAGELCLYARGEVARVTRQQSGNKQDPLCLPQVGRGAMARIHPIAKGNNPKPAPTAQQSEGPATDSTQTAPSPMLVGP